ncbi:MAG: hypothetical protein R6V20_00195 [Desulfobia sp.]
MGATITGNPNLYNFQKKIQQHIHNIESMKLYFILPWLYYHYIFLFYLNRRAIREVRKLMEECIDTCDGNCQVELCKNAKKTRNSLWKLYNLLPKKRIFSPLRSNLEKIFYDWDDIVEDSTLGQDQEFRDLISELSARV